jgi:hypothetical protein
MNADLRIRMPDPVAPTHTKLLYTLYLKCSGKSLVFCRCGNCRWPGAIFLSLVPELRGLLSLVHQGQSIAYRIDTDVHA